MILLGLLLAVLSGRSMSPYLRELSRLADEAALYEETAGSDPAEEKRADAMYAEAERARLLRIVDGDTIWVRVDGEKERKKVRFLEIDTPESVHSDAKKNTKYGERASGHLKELLDGVETIWLTRDRSDTDQYGRLLRMVWIKPPSDPFSETELREDCLNARLILDGYALPVTYDDDGYQAVFEDFLKEAKQEKRGLWADAGWRTFVRENS